MTKEDLIKRIQELDAGMQQAIANYNAMDGAKQECTAWLKKLEIEQKNLNEQKD